jgi:outer membrane protein assembly factor BamD
MRALTSAAVAAALSLAVPGLGAMATVTLLCGCGGEGPRTALGYTEDAKRAFDQAMASYNAHDWIEAQKLLREVKRKYSYSKYARLAELRIADADFEQEKYSDAIREYKDFVHAHRSDAEDVTYARARIAESTYSEIPETALVGTPEERDQASVVDAYKELNGFLSDYPDSKQSPHVRELLALVIARLVRHELSVARFYLAKDNYQAAVARIEYALHNYAPGVAATRMGLSTDADLDAEALLLLGQTYLKMHKWTDARQAFQTILSGHRASPLVVQARDYLLHLSEQGA